MACLIFLCFSQFSHSADARSALITESYYRVKWGYFDQFMDLFKKNHYPILKEMKRLGYIESIVVDYPINHASEGHRWDVRVTIVIPDTAKYKSEMAGVSKNIYPDQEKLKRDETERFRLLLAHQDIMIRRDDMSSW
jgi:hypothetical protein